MGDGEVVNCICHCTRADDAKFDRADVAILTCGHMYATNCTAAALNHTQAHRHSHRACCSRISVPCRCATRIQEKWAGRRGPDMVLSRRASVRLALCLLLFQSDDSACNPDICVCACLMMVCPVCCSAVTASASAAKSRATLHQTTHTTFARLLQMRQRMLSCGVWQCVCVNVRTMQVTGNATGGARTFDQGCTSRFGPKFRWAGFRPKFRLPKKPFGGFRSTIERRVWVSPRPSCCGRLDLG